MIIEVNFRDQPGLLLDIECTETGQRYWQLVQHNYRRQFPVYRDILRYTPEYVTELAWKAHDAFGWRWHQIDDFSSGIAPQLHKDLEELLARGFQHIPEQYDDLVHELHYGLHLLQHGYAAGSRQSWLQIEWYNDDGFRMPDDFVFRDSLEIGDVRLQNPFVGHGPLQMWHEQDFINIAQTCRFHDYVKPGICLVHRMIAPFTDFDLLLDKFLEHAPDFVAQHGQDKIKRYTGHPVIGKVRNINDLLSVAAAPNLELQSLDFYHG